MLREELWQIFHALAADGVTLLVSSHVMNEALRCDGLVLMREGEILLETTPDQLLEGTGTRDPETAFLRIIERADRPTQHGRISGESDRS